MSSPSLFALSAAIALLPDPRKLWDKIKHGAVETFAADHWKSYEDFIPLGKRRWKHLRWKDKTVGSFQKLLRNFYVPSQFAARNTPLTHPV